MLIGRNLKILIKISIGNFDFLNLLLPECIFTILYFNFKRNEARYSGMNFIEIKAIKIIVSLTK